MRETGVRVGGFYDSKTILDNFADAVRAENYRPLPDDWVVGFVDVVGTTEAVANGRYKAVNMLGAGVASTLCAFPFAFGGDGASFLVSAADARAAQEALATMAAFARGEFQFDLRVATIPLREIRAAGRDVRAARYGTTPYCVYAMFVGGGLAWFEDEVKSGRRLLPAAKPGARPDLSGLSCRGRVAPAKNGVVLSLIVAPRGDDRRFPTLVDEIVKLALSTPASDPPVRAANLRPATPRRRSRLKRPSGRCRPCRGRLRACSQPVGTWG